MAGNAGGGVPPDEGGGGDAPLTISDLSSNLKPDPELDNFLRKADEVSKLVAQLASDDPKEQERALRKADIYLHEKDPLEIPDDPEKVQCKVTKDRSQINKILDDASGEGGGGDMSTDAFMRMVEKDAKERAADRKRRKQESDEFRKKGNALFSKKDYAGALYNYNEAIKLIKDSPCLYNNRALTYLRLGIYSSTIDDCNKTLDLETYSFRGRMYKAKALFLSGEAEKCKEELEVAREILPGHIEMIDDYEQEIFNMGQEKPQEDFYTDQEKGWQNAAKFTGEFSPSKSNLSSNSAPSAAATASSHSESKKSELEIDSSYNQRDSSDSCQ